MTKDKKNIEKVLTVRMKNIEAISKTETSTVPLEEAKVSFNISASEMEQFKKWQSEKESAKIEKVVVTESTEDKVYAMWQEEKRLVKGVFRCREPEGGNVKFYFRKYKWDTTQEYIMEDGEVYEIPLAVARHLNQNCCYPIHSHILGSDGTPTLDTKGKKKSRMNFEGMEFSAVA